jgi:hypothetical protein
VGGQDPDSSAAKAASGDVEAEGGDTEAAANAAIKEGRGGDGVEAAAAGLLEYRRLHGSSVEFTRSEKDYGCDDGDGGGGGGGGCSNRFYSLGVTDFFFFLNVFNF